MEEVLNANEIRETEIDALLCNAVFVLSAIC